MSQFPRKLSPPPFLRIVRILLHFVAVALFAFILWLANVFEYLGTIRSDQESTKGPIAIGLLAALLTTIYGFDRLFLRVITRSYGHHPHDLHWSERMNRNGSPFCPDCQSTYIYQPDSGRDDDYVRCGDCGFAIATLGEMRPYYDARKTFFQKHGFIFKLRG